MEEKNNTTLYILSLVGVVVIVGGIWWVMQNDDPTAEVVEPNEEVLEDDGLIFDEEFSEVSEPSDASEGALMPPAPDTAVNPSAQDVQGESATAPQPSELSPVVFNMDSGMFFFEPNVIRAKVGQPVVVEVSASGVHDFVIDELNVRRATPDGETTRIEFTPTRAGSFEFYCSVGSHRQRGQVGTIIIEE